MAFKWNNEPMTFQRNKTDTKTRVSIIIPTYNQHKYLKQGVESIQKNTDQSYEIVFIHNGFTKGGSKWLRQLIDENPNYRLIGADKPVDTNPGFNDGLNASSGDCVVLLHNDVMVTEGWLSGMINFLESYQNAGLVGPMTTHIDGIQGLPKPTLLSLDQLDQFARKFRKKYRYRRVFIQIISDVCVGFKRSLLTKIGMFDEKFRSYDVMLEDFCQRSALTGFKNGIVADIFVYHGNHHKLMTDKKEALARAAEDRKAFKAKWNYLDPQSFQGKKLNALKAKEKGMELSQAGQVDRAVEMFLEGIKYSPGDRDVYDAMSKVLIDAGYFQRALEVLDRIPQNDDVKTEVRGEKTFNRNPANKTGQSSGHFSVGTQDVRRLELRGYCLEAMDRLEEAEACTKSLISMNSESATALNLKGLIDYRRGDHAAAADCFQKAIESDPGYGEPYTNLGILTLDAGQHQKALQLLERGFVLSPANRKSATNYHSAIINADILEGAEALFVEAAGLHPHNKRLKYLLIDLLLKQKKYKSAMKEIQAAMVLFGINDGILNAAVGLREKIGPKRIEKPIQPHATVSLCMIVKNEEAHLAKCLTSVDAIADEMIVVDTGSIDKTKDIARAFGAKVYESEWTNDFAAARNMSLSKASGAWIVVLDADEVISPSDHIVFQNMISKHHSHPVAYSFVTRNYTFHVNTIGWKPNDGTYPKEEAASGWTSSEKVRLFPNSGLIHFEYPIHELVEASLKRNGVKIKKCGIPIHHYGKLSQERTLVKIEPYYRLGKKKFDASQGDVIAIRELAVQAAIAGDHKEAVKLWEKFIELHPNLSEGYINIGTSFCQLGRYKDALKAAQSALKIDPQREEARYNSAISHLHLGNAKQAIAALESILERFPDYLPAQFTLAAAYCCDGRKEKGLEGFKGLRRTAISNELAFRCFDLARCLVEAQLTDYAGLLLEAAVESNHVSQDMKALLTKCIQIKHRRIEKNRQSSDLA